jgi:DMSO/TMAO reductase YedYZ molybdopterin-dependent catalytic subunit
MGPLRGLPGLLSEIFRTSGPGKLRRGQLRTCHVITKRNRTGTWRALRGAVAGLLAAAVALGVAELAAGIIGPLSSPVIAVGGAAINLAPVPVKDFAIVHFGSHDKMALELGILVLLAAFAALIGALAMRWLAVGLAGLVLFGVLGVVAALNSASSGPADALPSVVGVGAAAVVLTVLIRAARGTRRETAHRGAVMSGDPFIADTGITAFARPDVPDTGESSGPSRAPAGPSRRGFLALAGAAAAVAAVSGGAGEVVLRRFSAAAARAGVRLPRAAVKAAPVPAGAELNVSGITSFFTPGGSFYRVDTDLIVPQVSLEDWTLQITGMVDREVELTFAELLRLPLIEHDMTLVCVSNAVGGPYAGNARWLGASLPALLRRAGVKRGADQVLSMSTDGMTISTPVDTIMDGRQALIAVGMNGQPLPLEHGFPARMLVPGLYGYVSATKWVTRLELTTFASQRGYWTQRGYAARAPIKTESRIDVPAPLSQLKAGKSAVAGVAWAPHRGISAVEVNVDGGAWHTATLAAADGTDTWRQWLWAWDAGPGLHTLQVRATDGTGATQSAERDGVFPDGATGWDSVVVTVI